MDQAQVQERAQLALRNGFAAQALASGWTEDQTKQMFKVACALEARQNAKLQNLYDTICSNTKR